MADLWEHFTVYSSGYHVAQRSFLEWGLCPAVTYQTCYGPRINSLSLSDSMRKKCGMKLYRL